MRKTILSVCALVASLAISHQTRADIVINAIESGGNVLVTMSGDLDLGAFNGFHSNQGGYNGYIASSGAMSFGSAATDAYFLNESSYVPFGTGGFGSWSSSSGDNITMFTDPVLAVPAGYTTGTFLSALAQVNAATFASLGWTPGTYVNTFTNGGTSTRIRFNIGAVTVPEPGALALLGIGVMGLMLFRQRRK